jgi:predicted DNA binding CopG/RHH family protein
VAYSKAKTVLFSNLKPSLKAISLRLPESLIESLKVLAHKEDVPYQSLLKVLLYEAVQERLGR